MVKVEGVGCGGAVIKHSVNCVVAEGFWETVPAICAALIFPMRHMGRYLGFYATAAHVAYLSPPPFVVRQIITDFSSIY